MGCRPVPTSATLNDVKVRNSYYFGLFHNSIALKAHYDITLQWLKIDP